MIENNDIFYTLTNKIWLRATRYRIGVLPTHLFRGLVLKMRLMEKKLRVSPT